MSAPPQESHAERVARIAATIERLGPELEAARRRLADERIRGNLFAGPMAAMPVERLARGLAAAHAELERLGAREELERATVRRVLAAAARLDLEWDVRDDDEDRLTAELASDRTGGGEPEQGPPAGDGRPDD